MRERDLEALLVKLVKQAGGKAYKFISGENGVPDRICIFPGGKIVFVEMKTATGKLSKMQEYQHRKLRFLGCEVVVLRSKESVHRFVIDHME